MAHIIDETELYDINDIIRNTSSRDKTFKIQLTDKTKYFLAYLEASGWIYDCQIVACKSPGENNPVPRTVDFSFIKVANSGPLTSDLYYHYVLFKFDPYVP